MIGECQVGPFKLGDAMVSELSSDGLRQRIRPHLRPCPAVTYFVLKLGLEVARHPRIVLRALQTP